LAYKEGNNKMTTTLIYKQTCEVCEKIKNATLTVLLALWAFGESCGRARAAAQLHRDGFHEEAKSLYMDNKND
jgi:hypothetical protein